MLTPRCETESFPSFLVHRVQLVFFFKPLQPLRRHSAFTVTPFRPFATDTCSGFGQFSRRRLKSDLLVYRYDTLFFSLFAGQRIEISASLVPALEHRKRIPGLRDDHTHANTDPQDGRVARARFLPYRHPYSAGISSIHHL